MSTTFKFSDIYTGTESVGTTNTSAHPTLEGDNELELEITGVKNTLSKLIYSPKSPQETPEEINFQQLASEHAELIAQGKTSVEIAQWIGDKLNIPSWKAGEFYGERKVLSSPKTPEETERLQKFVEALGISFGKANQPSENHPQYLLLDGYVQNALFGSANMTQVDTIIDTFHTDWKKMGGDFTAKAQYLLEKTGLDIKWNGSKLTGMRGADGDFDGLYELFASGSLLVSVVRRLWLDQHFSDVNLGFASDARLCFLG